MTLHCITNIRRKGGFTLVETLVAITVLLLVIIGPMTVAQKGIQNAYYANDQVTAVFLAQEAIEAVRELRDRKALQAFNTGTYFETWDWISGISGGCISSNKCGFVRGSSNPIAPCSGLGNCVIRKSLSDVYTHTPGDPITPYTREITFETFGINSVKVTVDVYWNANIFGGVERHVTLQTWLYDHYQRFE